MLRSRDFEPSCSYVAENFLLTIQSQVLGRYVYLSQRLMSCSFNEVILLTFVFVIPDREFLLGGGGECLMARCMDELGQTFLS
jgi:hypothetical protein